MSRWKVSLRLAEAGAARAATMALSELLDPPADAASQFEEMLPAAPGGQVGWRVEAYFGEQPELATLRALLESILGAGTPDLELQEVPDLNWVSISQAALPPVTAGRFTVHGAHDRSSVPQGPWTIEIDAGEAFGTAHHATTYGCLEAIDRLTRRRTFGRVLDLGCGSAVLAIAAARALPRAAVLATDIDPVAVDVARRNVVINGCRGRIRTAVRDGAPRSRFDLLIANILAGPLIKLAPRVRAATGRGSRVVLSGILVPQAASVVAAYVSQGFSVDRHRQIAGWSTLVLVNRGGRPGRPRREA